jgi:hypothetical protein
MTPATFGACFATPYAAGNIALRRALRLPAAPLLVESSECQ